MRPLRLVCAALLVLSACGEDEPPPPAPRSGGRAAAAPGRAQTQMSTDRVQLLRRVEDRAGNDKERKTLRHGFRDTDFAFDPTGTMNRDPFRSYVIAQPGVSTTDTGGGLVAEPTDVCPAKKQIANGASVRELKLIGIVSRGTARWALLQEGPKGHIAHLGDCVGKEKARITKMGATFVEAEIAAEQTAQNQPIRPAEKIAFQLHPKQLPIAEDLEEADDSRGGRGAVSPGVAPPPGGRPAEL